jgi:hypothetical protein
VNGIILRELLENPLDKGAGIDGRAWLTNISYTIHMKRENPELARDSKKYF